MRHTRMTRIAAVGVAAVSIAACGSDSAADEEAADNTSSSAPSVSGTDAAPGALAGVCPETVVIQTDWFPESEHGALYQMVGEPAEIDADTKVVSGPLVSQGGVSTGVNIEIRTGGPAIGFQPVVSAMVQDDAITFGYVSTDAAIENYADAPTTAFVAPLEVNPQIIMWDPATYPDVETIADLATADDGAGVAIRYFETIGYMPYLLQSGQVTEAQLDPNYDGGPAVFIAEDGALAQQGFASSEPYNYEFVYDDWGRPIEFQLIHDTGWQIYSQPLAVLDARKEELADCMAAFTPIVQAATVDYYASPDTANALIIEAVNQYADFWTYDQGLADSSVVAQVELGLVGNGPDDVVGNFDMDRLAGVIEVAAPLFGAEGLTPADLATNEYIDESIGF